MNPFQGLFLPKPVRLTLTAASLLREELDRGDFNPILVELVADQAIRQIKATPGAFVKLYNEHQKSAADLSLFAFRLASGRILTSGRFHIYRGTLSFHGQELLKIHGHLSSEMLRLGFDSLQDVEKERMALEAAIQAVG